MNKSKIKKVGQEVIKLESLALTKLSKSLGNDFIKAVDSVLSSKIGEPFGDLIGGEVAHLQANRKSSAPRITATPQSIMELVKSGKLSLDELQAELKKLS